MPMNYEMAKSLNEKANRYGCGASTCVSCYPVIFACELCGADFALPYANGEKFTCDSCGWDGN